MSKVKRVGKRLEPFQQLPLFNETADPALSEDPPSKITPEQALAILKEHGMDVSLEQARDILSFLRRLTSIYLPQMLKE